MNWTDEPATWKQLKYLKQYGYETNRRLTKEKAAELIKELGGPPEIQLSVEPSDFVKVVDQGAYHFRSVVETAKRALDDPGNRGRSESDQKLASALAQRQQFWSDTFTGRTRMPFGCAQIADLYRGHGCLFCTPTNQQIQGILDALDSALPFWDRDHPELFYQTLAINFPEMARRRAC
ncbi:hypothetical protein SBV1_1340006 [Verrucomicrobia bacterium]|nr:hypothetical protein SBV1_1340006 [Verrucomicrobiota bacterium]